MKYNKRQNTETEVSGESLQALYTFLLMGSLSERK
jgi:hypothetical protein